MTGPRRSLYLYWGVVVLYVALLAWWAVFFSRQGDFLVRHIEEAGAPLSPEQALAVREAAGRSLRMFLFEGAFVGLMLVASVWFVFRALRREMLLHRQQRNFLSAVTHELKSPIASARLYLESLLLGRAEGEKRERYLRHAQEDLDRLTGVVDQVLESARLTTAAPAVATERVELSAFTSRALEALARDQALCGALVELEAPEPVAVQADPAALQAVLRNLLSNAVKYGGERPRVQVRVARNSRSALLEVRDFGPGLQGADPRKIFEPFVRGGDESVRTRPGVGLGLFLVAELVRAQGGSVRAREEDGGGGLTVSVSLPAEEA